ncbi:MAG: hypothetical protein VYA69_01535 [Gemmatimonadota bacterium]|nr:hypothetical protein [Gemmatimonadota bacterium]
MKIVVMKWVANRPGQHPDPIRTLPNRWPETPTIYTLQEWLASLRNPTFHNPVVILQHPVPRLPYTPVRQRMDEFCKK